LIALFAVELWVDRNRT